MKQDTVMQTGDKAKYKHVFLCGVARSETSVLGRNVARLRIARLQEYEDVYSIALASRPMKLSRQSSKRRRCRWRRRSRSLASKDLKSKHRLAFYA